MSPIIVSPGVPSVNPEKSTLITDIPTSSTELITTADPDEVEYCESNTYIRDCCFIYGDQCTVQCRECERTAKQISETIQCLSDKTVSPNNERNSLKACLIHLSL